MDNKTLDHKNWLDKQIDDAFTKLEEGRAVFTPNEKAKAKMQATKDKIKDKHHGQ